MLDFRVLGHLEVVADNNKLPLGGPKQRAVLALLTLRSNQVVPNHALVDALWGATPPRSAAGVLRTYLSRLRQELPASNPPLIESQPPGYVLAIDPDHVDAHRFERLVDRGRRERAADRPDLVTGTLQDALGLWRGDALADLEGFEALRAETARLDELRLVATEDLFDAELALGHHAELVADLEELTTRHPFRERLWGQLILALYRSHRQTDALAAYQAMRSALVEQAGLEPSEALQALEHAVLQQSGTLHLQAPSTRDLAGRVVDGADTATRGGREGRRLPLQGALMPQAKDQPLVGRTAEKAVLTDAVRRASEGMAGAVSITGPPGIGKTALVRWCADAAHAEGATVLLGRADEDAGAPLQPLGEAIDHWARHVDHDGLQQVDPGDLALIARISPVVAGHAPGGVDPPPPDPETSRPRLFEALSRWVATVAGPAPAVFVLEDLQWADPAALLALRHLLRHPPAAGALLLLTHRPTEVPAQHLADLRADAAASGLVDHVELTGLTAAEVARMIPTQASHEPRPPGTLAAHLAAWTGGNPLFVLETLRHLAEGGAVEQDDGGWLETRTLESLGVPPQVTMLVDRRLQRLPPETAEMLRPAAVLGEQFDVPTLSRVAEMPAIEVLDALGPATTAGLVASAGGDRFAFAHGVVRDAVLAGLPAGRLARLHWQTGQALAALTAADPDPHLGDVAHHLTAGVHAGDPEAAIEASVRAGRQALATLAYEQAGSHFTAATELLESSGVSSPDLTYDAWVGYGHAAAALADDAGIKTGYGRAASVARENGWRRRHGHAVIGLATAFVRSAGAGHGAPYDPRETLAVTAIVDDTLSGLGTAPGPARSLLLAVATIHAVMRDHRDRARSLAEQTADVARQVDDAAATAASLLARSWILLGSPAPNELRLTSERALAQPTPPEVTLLVSSFLLPVLAVPSLQEGNLAAYAATRQRLLTQPDRHGPITTDIARQWDAAVALAAGRWDEARRLTDLLAEAPEFANLQGAVAVQRLFAHRWRSHPAERADGLAAHLASHPENMTTRAWLTSTLAMVGKHREARREVEILLEQDALTAATWSTPLILAHLAEVTVRLGDRDLAAVLLPVLLPYSGQMLVPFTATTLEGAADGAIGQVMLTLGRPDEAVDHLAAATDLSRAMEAEALAVHSSYWHARALLARGRRDDRSTADRLLQRASSAAGRLQLADVFEDLPALGGRAEPKMGTAGREGNR